MKQDMRLVTYASNGDMRMRAPARSLYVRVGFDKGFQAYYADCAELGMSKNYATPVDAIKALFGDHDFIVLKIEEGV
jgi:hypothetical protein